MLWLGNLQRPFSVGGEGEVGSRGVQWEAARINECDWHAIGIVGNEADQQYPLHLARAITKGRPDDGVEAEFRPVVRGVFDYGLAGDRLPDVVRAGHFIEGERRDGRGVFLTGRRNGGVGHADDGLDYGRVEVKIALREVSFGSREPIGHGPSKLPEVGD